MYYDFGRCRCTFGAGISQLKTNVMPLKNKDPYTFPKHLNIETHWKTLQIVLGVMLRICGEKYDSLRTYLQIIIMIGAWRRRGVMGHMVGGGFTPCCPLPISVFVIRV